MTNALTLQSFADDPTALRTTFALFPSGVAAISATTEGPKGPEPVVLVASSFQVGISLDPPLVLFAVQHTSSSWPRLQQAARQGRRLGVSVLGEAHDLAARQLASKAADRFAGIQTTTTATGAHFIHGAPVWLECSIFSEVPAGDHDVVLLQVHALGNAPDTEPLVWHSSGFRTLAPRATA
ncbi:flavin reductase family protein [Kineococcus sp. SYSU DK003]|uniref:flavin reductase family protein n=1 Tax=Kineococcus sp. SYSU DK003 TaxID=3383124 RepID=UPI003D7DC865